MPASESEWIRQIQEVFARHGVLDHQQRHSDAPSMDLGAIRINVDACVAGTHFPWPSPFAGGCGRRALLAAASDLAAVGTRPEYMLLSLVVPAANNDTVGPDSIQLAIEGMAAVAAEMRVILAGGNVTRGKFAFHTITIGSNVHRRAGLGIVESGDLLWLTGTHGDAMAELALMQHDIGIQQLETFGITDRDSWHCSRYWSPDCRFSWGDALWRMPFVMGVTDVSDGWLKDVMKFANTADYPMGVRLDPERVPRSSMWQSVVARDGDVLRESYWGGDDYELAFVTRNEDERTVATELERVGVCASCIGQVIEGAGLHWQTQPVLDPPAGFGYDPYLL